MVDANYSQTPCGSKYKLYVYMYYVHVHVFRERELFLKSGNGCFFLIMYLDKGYSGFLVSLL